MKKKDRSTIILKPIKEHNNENEYIKSSKIGGVPYWNEEKDISLIKENLHMLIAQINLEEINPELLNNISEHYPQKGILQFFMADNSHDYEERLEVIHHENINLPPIMDKDYKDYCLKVLETNHDLPIQRNILISLEEGEIDRLYIAENNEEEYVAEEKNYSIIDQLLLCKLGGIPYLGQYGLDTDYDEDSITLLYLASLEGIEGLREKDLGIMWGDGGEGVFQIGIEDLKNKDFSKAEFYWSCE